MMDWMLMLLVVLAVFNLIVMVIILLLLRGALMTFGPIADMFMGGEGGEGMPNPFPQMDFMDVLPGLIAVGGKQMIAEASRRPGGLLGYLEEALGGRGGLPTAKKTGGAAASSAVPSSPPSFDPALFSQLTAGIQPSQIPPRAQPPAVLPPQPAGGLPPKV